MRLVLLIVPIASQPAVAATFAAESSLTSLAPHGLVQLLIRRRHLLKLRHVIANLVDNAVRFVPAGAGVIDIGATREDGCVVLSVRDNGVGIPAEHHEEIFKMFRRVPDGEDRGRRLAR